MVPLDQSFQVKGLGWKWPVIIIHEFLKPSSPREGDRDREERRLTLVVLQVVEPGRRGVVRHQVRRQLSATPAICNKN